MENLSFGDEILNNIKSNSEASILLDHMNLNWTVSKQPLSLPNGSETPYFGIVRDDTQRTFSTCKKGYQPFQNEQLAEILIRLSEKTGFEIHKGGSFDGGAKVFMQLKSPNLIKNIGTDETQVKGFLTGINSHDGSTSLKWGETNITISCSNQFARASKNFKKFRHTSSIHSAVEDSLMNIEKIVQDEKSMFETFLRMSEVEAKPKFVKSFLDQFLQIDTNKSVQDLRKEHSGYKVNRAKDVLNSISKEMNSKGNTLWGLFSGITYYTNHRMPTAKRLNSRTESIEVGSAFKINNQAFAEITKELV